MNTWPQLVVSIPVRRSLGCDSLALCVSSCKDAEVSNLWSVAVGGVALRVLPPPPPPFPALKTPRSFAAAQEEDSPGTIGHHVPCRGQVQGFRSVEARSVGCGQRGRWGVKRRICKLLIQQ